MSELVVKDLHVSVDGKLILKGVNLTVRQGEIHALMGTERLWGRAHWPIP